MKKKLCAAMLALLVACPSFHAQNLLNETQEQKDKRMEWFHKAKLGRRRKTTVFSNFSICRLRKAPLTKQITDLL